MKKCKWAFVALGALAGCGSLPTVEYKKLDGWDPEGRMRYALPKSIIVIDYPKDKNGERISSGESGIELTAVPAESKTFLAVAANDPWGRKTTLQWTKISNTDLLASVGTEVVDNRKTVISAIGAAAVDGLSIVKSPFWSGTLEGNVLGAISADPVATPPQEPYPVAFDPYDFPRVKINQEFVLKSGKSSITLFVNFLEDAPPGAALFRDKESRGELNQMRHVLLTSACRTINVEIRSGKFRGKSFTTKVADPSYVQTIPLPKKGTISFHSVCGANLAAAATTDTTGIELVATTVAQSKSLLEAWSKTKN
ncbi:hypothetical protein [Pseudomonas oryzihabitans]|uniref:hypothetical protein n=1 Tax=Pseudomonas oryzihabitans TaxID=47885 RepID=UPI00142ED1C7|nr:hypothetical protein [Pseudomonas psychrotolerans]